MLGIPPSPVAWIQYFWHHLTSLVTRILNWKISKIRCTFLSEGLCVIWISTFDPRWSHRLRPTVLCWMLQGPSCFAEPRRGYPVSLLTSVQNDDNFCSDYVIFQGETAVIHRNRRKTHNYCQLNFVLFVCTTETVSSVSLSETACLPWRRTEAWLQC
jgi:hypothetical protein